MTTFKSIAYQILKEAGKPFHSREITRRALERGLVSEEKTSEATMNAQLLREIKSKGNKSRFTSVGRRTSNIMYPHPTSLSIILRNKKFSKGKIEKNLRGF